MELFTSRHFDDHEQVAFFSDTGSGLRAIIAVHNTNLGPALGGVRMWPYGSEAEALADVLRLSRGMTYKSALAGLRLGGGKAVIIGDPRTGKSDPRLRAMGRCVERMGGRYIAAEDSGTTVADMKKLAKETRHVVGVADKVSSDGADRSGDPSPTTARGVFLGLRAAVRHRLQRNDLDGIRVAVQGVGSVGTGLARMLSDSGATLTVSDVDEDAVERAVEAFGASAVPVDDIYRAPVDVFAPCGLGGTINDATIDQLQARVVAGAANNQLAEARHGRALMERGILYAPDYVINAGGVIDVAFELEGRDGAELYPKVDAIAGVLSEIFARAEVESRPTSAVADDLARERYLQAA